MNHSGTQHFNPAGVLADRATLPQAVETGNICFHRWFGEGEVTRPQTNLELVTEERLGNHFQGSLQVSHGDVLADNHPFNLVELVTVGRVIRIPPVNLPGRNHL